MSLLKAVGLSLAVLLAQNHEVTAITTTESKAEKLNQFISPIQDDEIERFFRRLKRFRRIFTRYDKLDVLFAGFILFAMIIDALV